MNILFFIGNGFDLNIGMKTSYGDFYNYYHGVKSDNPSVEKLKKEISNNIKLWSDLELALGEYTESIGTQEEFNEVFEDIGDNLAMYLQQEESRFDFSRIDRKELFDCLSYPERYLPPTDNNQIKTFKEKWKFENWNVRIITFNYTRTIENLIGEKLNKTQIGTHHNRSIDLQGVEHIHGYVNERMVMGVNDVSQIKNSSFHKNQNVLEALVKVICNQVSRQNIDEVCKQQVSSANLICIFGSSIGDTDNMWWELIGKRLLGNCKLIIFHKTEEISPLRPYKKLPVERDYRHSFLRKANLTEEERNRISDNIYIGLNTEIFDLIKEI